MEKDNRPTRAKGILLDENGKEIITPIYDVSFKSIFKDTGNDDVVEDFLRAVLDIPKDTVFGKITVKDPEMLPEASDGKISILDVLVEVEGMGIFNVEMQLWRISGLENRIVHYLAKMLTNQLGKGDSYSDLDRVVSIVMTDFSFIDGSPEKYFHRYVLYDPEEQSQLTNLMEFAIIELSKVPQGPSQDARHDWAKFFASRSYEELKDAAQRREMVGKAMLTLEKLSADENARYKAEREEMMRRDYVAVMDNARSEGWTEGETIGLRRGETIGLRRGRAEGRTEAKSEIAKRMAKRGMTEAEIAEVLGD
jgi:predicted transposase/invertase (TIGR01784 family)